MTSVTPYSYYDVLTKQQASPASHNTSTPTTSNDPEDTVTLSDEVQKLLESYTSGFKTDAINSLLGGTSSTSVDGDLTAALHGTSLTKKASATEAVQGLLSATAYKQILKSAYQGAALKRTQSETSPLQSLLDSYHQSLKT